MGRKGGRGLVHTRTVECRVAVSEACAQLTDDSHRPFPLENTHRLTPPVAPLLPAMLFRGVALCEARSEQALTHRHNPWSRPVPSLSRSVTLSHTLPPAMLFCRVALCEARSELAAAGDSFVKLEAIHRSGNAQGGSRR